RFDPSCPDARAVPCRRQPEPAPVQFGVAVGGAACRGVSFALLVATPCRRKILPVFAEVADLDQCRPQLERSPDVVYDVVHDPAQVLLEEVGLEAVEGLLQADA